MTDNSALHGAWTACMAGARTLRAGRDGQCGPAHAALDEADVCGVHGAQRDADQHLLPAGLPALRLLHLGTAWLSYASGGTPQMLDFDQAGERCAPSVVLFRLSGK